MLRADPLDLNGVLEAVLPLDAERRGDWSIWFAFWTEALTSERLRADQRGHSRSTVERFAGLLRALAAEGHALTCPVDEAAHRLGALVQGIAAKAMFDRHRWDATRQRTTLAGELSLRGLPTRLTDSSAKAVVRR